MEERKKYWVGFNLVKGIGPVRLRALLNHFGGIEEAWNASVPEITQFGLSKKIIENFVMVRRDVDLDDIIEKIQAKGIYLLTWEDENRFPRKLQEINNPPPLLYVCGEILKDDEWAVAIVGTRRVTAYGRQIASELATHLARNGITVVSGLARGVDAIAHQAALNAGGRTIAVLGSGVDRIYPPENRRLAEQITTQGAVVSDYPIGTPPEGVNFPPRNRIISGLSLGVVVVEAGQNSGALITANFAADQGREVFAVPGSILSAQSKGSNWLIQQGAQPLLSPKDVLEFLNLTRVTDHRAARKILPANKFETQLLEIVSEEPKHLDEISIQSKYPIESVSATLAMMELKGLVRQVGGMRYSAVREIQTDYDSDIEN